MTGRCLRLSASYFNSRPHGGRRDSDRIKDVFAYISTHALTEGDHILIRYSTRYPHFNSRPHGGRPELYALFFQIFRISTHALTEGDGAKMDFHIPNLAFQLTPSRRATLRCELAVQLCNISTHALTEGDGNISLCQRLQHISTHALTEGDRGCWSCWKKQNISTHALTEGDNSVRHFYRSAQYFNSRPHGGRQADRRQAHGSQKHFNSRPHGGRQLWGQDPEVLWSISTHALTEGDGKFRQIFLLNRGYAYSISLYFLPHFISLLPQILSFQQKSFKFQVRIFLLFSVHLAFALQNQCVHHVKSRFCTNMFYFVFVLFTQIVKPQTIGLFIYDFF